ncbi:MAG: mannose-6-phosphate isomerase, class I [Acidimicrobiales bacterium]|nr:mannose-6-phosphate isomerase, class I [Acidimicrobiales bacterium]
MQRLTGVVQHYDWGSHGALAGLRGEAATTEPEAELWLGAHPAAPSVLTESGDSLLARIETDPVGMLGGGTVERYGPRLPFLLKLLAADSPLSIQAHPSPDQAAAGFAYEESMGIPRDASNRSFRDNSHKPELIVSLTPFEALVGFRDANATADFFSALEMETAGWLLERLDRDGPKGVVEMMLSPTVSELDELDVTEISFQLGEACRAYEGEHWTTEASVIAKLDQKYGGDPGIVVAALLNRVLLQPGEGVYLDAGHLHAYVGGLGVEIMANSDNVLRGGLTSKRVDVPNLLNAIVNDILDPRPVPMTEDGRYLTPAAEFELTRIEYLADRAVDGPAIVLAVEEDTTVSNDLAHMVLSPTEAAWIGAGEMAQVASLGLAFLATVGPTTTLIEG